MLVTLTGRYLSADRSPGEGVVTFTPDVAAANIDLGAWVTNDPVVIVPDKTGGFSTELVASDDPSWSAEGLVSYTVVENIIGAPTRTYRIVVLSPGPWELHELQPSGLAPDVVVVPLEGPPGPANTLTVGTVTTGDPGTPADVTITGDAPDQTISFTIPKGDPGDAGAGNPSAADITDATATGQALITAADAAAARTAIGAGTGSSDFDGEYSSLTGTPTLGTAAAAAVGDFATATRTITAGAGLTGGGDLSTDRTLAVGAGTGITVNDDDIEVVYGTTAGTAAEGNDPRLSDARTPTDHAASHASAGSDPVTLAQSQVANLTVDLAAKAPAAAITDSPRDALRVTNERRPMLVVDRAYPNLLVDHRILYVDEASAYMFAHGHDRSLRVSRDQGVSWNTATANSGASAIYGMNGMFLKSAGGLYFTTSQASSTTAPSIERSADGGATFSTKVPAAANVFYLGPTSICEDPITGYLYVVEYVIADAATKSTWRILRSTNNGGSFETFATFQRNAATYPTTAVRHGHGAQYDPVSQRVYFTTGDSGGAAGIYRVNAAGTGVEAVVTNAQLDTESGYSATGVGLMFFPDTICWGVDAASDSSLMILDRASIGGTPVVTKGARFNSTAFYTVRTKTDGTEWILLVSDENGVGGRLDNAHHLYRVADNGATVDEIGAIATNSATNFSYLYPVSTPLQAQTSGLVWIGGSVPSAVGADTSVTGYQAAIRIAWGAGTTMQRPLDLLQRNYYNPVTVSWRGSLAAGESQVFAVTAPPIGPRSLYILETTSAKISGSGAIQVDVYDSTAGALVKTFVGAVDLKWSDTSTRSTLNEGTGAWVARSALVTAGHVVHIRATETSGASSADGVASLTYAWGFSN